MANYEIIAHVKKNDDGLWEKPQLLQDHLKNTACLAEKFVNEIGIYGFGKICGLLHDAGKSTDDWQEYFREITGFNDDLTNTDSNNSGKMKHAIYGAKLVEEKYKKFGRFMSYCIAGHHSGLPDYYNTGTKSGLRQCLSTTDTSKIPKWIIENLGDITTSIPNFGKNKLSASLWIRMLFSSLVDADFLDTEVYMQPCYAHARNNFPSIGSLSKRFDSYMENMKKNASNTLVNELRNQVYNDCLWAANCSRGIFSLTVPTGGGKTLSSMAFALKHACCHNMKRIIYVIPYTSIIEQTAEVFKKVFGSENVIEHHSNFYDESENSDEELILKYRLAAENWDAPIIVTTSVQFFESLFSAKPSRCRKLHNISNSVIIIDEAQLIPSDYLEPIKGYLVSLVRDFGVTAVICTATQPAWFSEEDKKNVEVTEIIKNVDYLYENLKRANVFFPNDINKVTNLEELAEELKQYSQVLCIVSDRKTCHELHKLMPKDTIHLSALMCAQHRSDCIGRIKADLISGKDIRVISTQLVEAGVDIDFPVVYRTLAGLDSIAQAAGRCNREGLLTEHGQKKLGKVVVVNLAKQPPVGILRKAANMTKEMICLNYENILAPCVFKDYFGKLFKNVNSLDKNGIVGNLTDGLKEMAIQFRTVSDKFKIIDDSMQKTIIVKYGESISLIDYILSHKIDLTRKVLRELQRYSVNIYKDDFKILQDRGSIVELWQNSNVWALSTTVDYNETGLCVEQEFVTDNFVV